MRRFIMLACILTSLFFSVQLRAESINGFEVTLTETADGYTGRIVGVTENPSGTLTLNDSDFTYNGKQVYIIAVADKAFHDGSSGYNNKLSNVTQLTINLSRLDTLGAYTFRDCTTLTSVTLNEGLKVIKDEAFRNCQQLAAITIPGSVTSMGNTLFYGCSALTTVTFARSNDAGNPQLTIGYDSKERGSMFKENSALRTVNLARNLAYTTTPSDGDFKYATFGDNANITTLNIQAGCTEIGAFLFRDCVKLATINVDTNCLFTAIGEDAFRNCELVTSSLHFNMAEGSAIGARAFRDCEKVPAITLSEGVVLMGDEVFRNCVALTTITIPDSVTSLGNSTFYGCAGLSSINLGESVGSIGDKAFYNCAGITELAIPGAVLTIGDDAFVGCDNLATVRFNRNENGELLLVGAVQGITGAFSPFSECENLKTVHLARTVDEDYEHAYEGALEIKNLETLYIEAGCDSLMEQVLAMNVNLEQVFIADDNTLQKISDAAFHNATILRLIELEKCVNLTYIGDAFSSCSNLTRITIPGSVNVIDDDIFSYATSLQEVTFLPSPDENNPTLEIVNPFAGVFKYTNLQTLNLARNISYTQKNPFGTANEERNEKLATVNINVGCTAINDELFRDCIKITNVRLAEGLETIGAGAFRNCEGITAVAIPGSVTTIGNGAFYDCSALTSVTFLPNEEGTPLLVGYDNISDDNCSLFANNSAMKTAHIARNFTYSDTPTDEVNIYALFSGNTNLTTLYFGEGCDAIAPYLFNNCTALTSVTIPSYVTTIGAKAFNACTSLSEVTLCEGVESIGSYAFAGCTALPTIILPTSLEHIQANTFSGCTALTDISALPATPPTVDDSSAPFYGNASLYVDAESFAAYQEAPYWSGFYGKLSTLPTEFTVGGITYAIPSITEAKVTVKSNTLTGYVDIPETVINPYDNTPYTVVAIEANAFSGSDIQKIYIPKGVVENVDGLPTGVFNNVSSLTHIIVASDEPVRMNAEAIFNATILQNVTLYRPEYVADKYDCDMNPWSEFYKRAVATSGEDTQFVVDNLLYKIIAVATDAANLGTVRLIKVNDTSITPANGTVTIPNTVVCPDDKLEYAVTEIGGEAFKDYKKVQTVVVSGNVVTIGGNAFRGCSLQSIDFCKNAAGTPLAISYDIDGSGSMFKHNSALRTVNLARNLAYMATPSDADFKYATFADNSNIATVNIQEGCTEIGAYLFRDCENLTVVNIDENIQFTFIGDDAFRNCYSISHALNFNMTNGATVGARAFRDCKLLSSLTFTGTLAAVGEDAFRNCMNIRSIALSMAEGTTIGNAAFRDCLLLTSVTFDGAATLGSEAFRNCEKLASITIPGSVTSIGNNAFYDCSMLQSITFAANNTGTPLVIGHTTEGVNNSMFMDNGNLRTVNIARNFTYDESDIIYAPFSECEQLTTVNIMEGCTEIGAYLFRDCTGLSAVNIAENIIFTRVGNDAFRNCAQLTSLALSMAEGSTIGNAAFRDCVKLHSLTFEGASIVGDDGFRNCQALTDFTIPGSVLSIGTNAFKDCDNIETLRFNRNENGDLLEIGLTHVLVIGVTREDAPFKYSDNLRTIHLARTVDLGVYSSGDGAFSRIPNLEEVYIEAGCDSLMLNSLSYNTKLSTVHIAEDNTLEHIGIVALGACDVLENIELEKCTKLKTILNSAFLGCEKLEEISIPGSVTYMDVVFSSCSSLREITFLPSTDENNPPLEFVDLGFDYNFFENCDLNTINIARNFKYTHSPFYGQYYINNVNIGEGCTVIGDELFRDFINLWNLTIAEGVETIGAGAFRNCKNTTSITIPSSVTEIGARAFYDCEDAISINIPDGITEICEETFGNCAGISSITIPSSVTKIGAGAFSGCTTLSEIALSECIDSIGDEAFRSCAAITSITIPGSVTSIGNNAFYDCNALTEITFLPNPYNTPLAIGYDSEDDGSMFKENIATVTLARDFDCVGGELTDDDIKYTPFGDSNKLATVNICLGATTIGDYAFRDCENLTQINIEPQVMLTGISKQAFRNCVRLKSIELPASLESIGDLAFHDCDSLVDVSCYAMTPPSIVATTFDATTYSNATLSVVSGVTSLYREDDNWGLFSNINGTTANIEALITCDKNYVLDCVEGTGWDVAMGDNMQAIFTNVITGESVTLQGSVEVKTVEQQQYTSVIYYLSQSYVEAVLGTAGPHCFTHVTFVKMNGEEVAHSTGNLYYSDVNKPVYDLTNEEWIAVNVSTHLNDVEADGERTLRIYAAEGCVVVNGVAEGETIAIYDAAGLLCHSSRANSNVQRIALPAHGIYIVRAGARVEKVVL